MSAQRVVRIAYLATNAGSIGCEDFARNVKHNKNCARLLNSILKCEEVRAECLHSTTIPVSNGRKRERACRQPVATIPVFEVFARQFSKDPRSFLKHRLDPDLLSDNFHSHEVVSRYGAEHGIPCRIFADFAVLDRQACRTE